ncbi:MAG: small, acid-soluble spore protein, alpha/beta type [Acetivibrionales bacterium]|jgi:hypothetical protein
MNRIGNNDSWGDANMLKKDEQLKLEIAEELGLLERIQKEGWKSLSAKETGRIGGLLSRKKRSKAI